MIIGRVHYADRIHIKMAVLKMLCALFMFWLFLIPESMSTSVEMSVPVHPITVGGILPIQCQINDMEDGNTVRIFRKINDQTEQITSGLTVLYVIIGTACVCYRETNAGKKFRLLHDNY